MDDTGRGPRRVGGRKLVAAVVVLAAGAALVVAGVKYFTPAPPPGVTQPAEPAAPAGDARLAAGQHLYTNHCAQCHGDKGNGDGPAARFLFPRPRNFGEGKFRLVSTTNRKPTDEDLLAVVTRGMPGSAMFPFAHLPETDRQTLVAYVRHLMRTGMEERVRREAAERGREVDEQEVTEGVATVLTPADPLEVPADLPPPSAGSVDHGRELYLRDCAGCHGKEGKGDGTQDQHNDDGTPTRPRDFTRGIFKGGRTQRDLYTRVMLGLPGSPMPASVSSYTPAQTADVVNFLLTLSDPAAQEKVEHRRAHVVARRSAVPLAAEAAWASAPAVHVVVSPLWWRNYEDPDLHVQALHDGKEMALRLSWRDASRDDHPVRPQDFEDVAAVQLFKGSPEPFLGMGGGGKPVDVWVWRAGWKGSGGPSPDVDTTYPNMHVDLYPFERPGAGPRPHPTERQPREFLTAPAAGNLRSDPGQPFTGHSLQAKGPGTLTMRPVVSQLVSASGEWKDGRWTVVLRRPLEVGGEAGVPLAAGDKLAVGFAVWDGAAGDRNGQKLVSIWHDLELE